MSDGQVNCQEIRERLERFLDGELPSESVESMSAHLADCYGCGDRAEFEQQLRTMVRESCAERAPDTLLVKIRGYLDSVEA